MKISARNQLAGTITETTTGAAMAEVVVKVDASIVVAAIAKSSLESLDLKAGDKVTVIIKATEVIIGK
jgi:molybdate transport system regulatory protein